MYVAWEQDERPVWRLICVFKVQDNSGEQVGRLESRRLERVLAATGTVRGTRVLLEAGRAAVTLLVRGADEVEAAHRGLSIVDVAVRQVTRLRLGELVERRVTPAPLVVLSPAHATAGA